MNIHPEDLFAADPSEEAARHADHVNALYEEWHTLAKRMANICQKLIDADAACPTFQRAFKHRTPSGTEVYTSRTHIVSPDSFIDPCDDLAEADFSKCWGENAEEYDRGAESSARETASEARAGR